MNEVKVYDSSGNLKKVISINQLKTREQEILNTPSMFRRNKRTVKPPVKIQVSKDNTGKP